ncbi:MAG: hypothetical protein ACM3ML_04090 [Micromonosporaceae bacterium]
MSPPNPQQLKVAIGAFTTDAKLWDDTANTLDQARSGAAGITIDSLAFGPAAWFGVADKYKQVQQMVADRCGEGVTEFHTIASNLIKSRDAYQKAEDDNVHAINNSW